MRRAPDDARVSDGARGGVDLIHASLSSAEKVDIARAACRALGLRPSGSRIIFHLPCGGRAVTGRQKMKVTK